MPRCKIDLPDTFFDITINIPVRITDINYGNHVGNDSVVSILHEARMQFLDNYGYNELNIEGIGLIMSDLSVEFKNETFYKDTIAVKIGRGDISKVSFELIYTLSVARDQNTIVIANAKTTMVCYDYGLKKIASLPQKLKDILS